MKKNIFYTALCGVFVCAFALSCAKDSTSELAPSNTGKSGSTARFALVGDFLYTVDDKSLRVFRINEPETPIFITNTPLGIGIETIFSLNNNLLIGASDGMYIYDITQPAAPLLLSKYVHIRRCDPVVANDSIAFVTLRTDMSSSRCGPSVLGQTNVLEVIDIRNRTSPTLIQTYPMDNPYGVGLDNNLLFVCDANALKVLNVGAPFSNIPTISSLNIKVNDVIPLGGHLLAVGAAAIYDIDYTDPRNLRILSQIKRTQRNSPNTGVTTGDGIVFRNN